MMYCEDTALEKPADPDVVIGQFAQQHLDLHASLSPLLICIANWESTQSGWRKTDLKETHRVGFAVEFDAQVQSHKTNSKCKTEEKESGSSLTLPPPLRKHAVAIE
jgi:hypothetical protein